MSISSCTSVVSSAISFWSSFIRSRVDAIAASCRRILPCSLASALCSDII